MTFIARRTNEYLQWRGKEYPISKVKIEHAFHPVPSDISPSTQTYLRVSLNIDLAPESTSGFPSPFTGAYPHRGDTVTLLLQQFDDRMQQTTGPNKKWRFDQTVKKMVMLVDNVSIGDEAVTLSLTQQVDGFSNKINSDPNYHWRNQFYGWLVGEKEKFFEDNQALRYTNPTPAYQIGVTLAAAGYTYAPPATPTTILSMPIFGSLWTNQWDNPCYVQDPRTWNDIVGPEGQIGNLDNADNLGLTVGGYSRNGVGASGEIIQSRSNRDTKKPPALWYDQGGSWVTEGIVKVAQTRRVAPYGYPAEHRRSDIFASWMIRWDPSYAHMGNLYQVKIMTEDACGASVRWDDSGKVELYFNQYEDRFPESKETRATVMWTGQLPMNVSARKSSAVLEQNGNSVRFYAAFGGGTGVVDSGFIQMPRNLHAVSGVERNLPAWAEVWIFNDVKNGNKLPRSGVCGLQVSVIPDNQPYRDRFLNQVRTQYQQWEPKVNLTAVNRIINQTAIPSIRNRTSGEVLKDLCEALAISWWIDADGVAQVCPLEFLVSGSRGVYKELDPSYDIGAFGIDTDLTQTCSRIEVEYSDWAISQTRKTQIDVWKKGGSIAIGDTLEDFVQPEEDTEWLDLDTSVEDQGVKDWRWISDNNGSFYGGSTIVTTQIKRDYVNTPGQWEDRLAATIDCQVVALSPWVTKLTQRAISGTFQNSETDSLKRTTAKDIQLRSSQYDFRPGSKTTNPLLIGVNVPDIELPVIRARGTMKRVKQKYTVSGGTPNARTLTLEGWDFIDNRGFAKEVTDVLSKYVLDAQPHFTNLEVPYDLSIVLGSVVTINGMNSLGKENVFGAIVKGVICGLVHSPDDNTSSLTVWVFSYDQTTQTWETVEANNESGKRTWQQLEDTRQRQGTTWDKAEKNPLL